MRLLIAVTAMLFSLSACLSGGNYAPVEGMGGAVSTPAKTYIVQAGDTLYSLAFAYGLDYRGLAAANHIAAPYLINPGQKINLKEAAVTKNLSAKPHKKLEINNSAAAGSKTSETKVKVVSGIKNPPPIAAKNPPAQWRWPHRGTIVRSFSLGKVIHTGIDISGIVGQPVTAVAAGDVVYAGTGVRGYGQMVIIKHSEHYLSAYGHNSRIRVAEGQTVKQGEHIADLGSSGTDTPKLHFEIRREGKPVNPLVLLAK